MKQTKLKSFIAEIIYLFVIFFFCYTAVNKLMNIDSFRTNLIKTSLFSIEVAKYFSIAVIILEIIIILILILNKKKGLLLLIIAMLGFTIYISYLRFKGLYEVCGCGGILNGLSYQTHFFINILLIFGSVYSFIIFNLKENEK